MVQPAYRPGIYARTGGLRRAPLTQALSHLLYNSIYDEDGQLPRPHYSRTGFMFVALQIKAEDLE